jgi:hypothetical protein
VAATSQIGRLWFNVLEGHQRPLGVYRVFSYAAQGILPLDVWTPNNSKKVEQKKEEKLLIFGKTFEISFLSQPMGS